MTRCRSAGPAKAAACAESAVLLNNLPPVGRGRTEYGQVTDLTPFAGSP